MTISSRCTTSKLYRDLQKNIRYIIIKFAVFLNSYAHALLGAGVDLVLQTFIIKVCFKCVDDISSFICSINYNIVFMPFSTKRLDNSGCCKLTPSVVGALTHGSFTTRLQPIICSITLNKDGKWRFVKIIGKKWLRQALHSMIC